MKGIVLELERERRTRARVKRLAELVRAKGPAGARWIEGVLARAGKEAANDDGRDEDASEDGGR